jgi:hypothetical protein
MLIAQTDINLYTEAQNRLPGATGVTAAGGGFGAFVGSMLQSVMVVAAVLVFMYMIWGAIDWISAAGDSSKIQKARNKITGAVIGILVLAAVVALFIMVQQILGIEVFRFGAASGTPTTVSTPGTPTTGGSTCAGGIAVGQFRNDGGAGGYCSGGGAARVQCHGADSHLSYPHFDPCSCMSGTPLPGYDFSSC